MSVGFMPFSKFVIFGKLVEFVENLRLGAVVNSVLLLILV